MSKKKKLSSLVKRRNLLHNHPLLKKSGAHVVSRKKDRQMSKVKLRKGQFDQSASHLVCFDQAA